MQGAPGGAGHDAFRAGEHMAGVDQVEAVHVLFRQDLRQGGVLVQVLRQRQLHQDAVDSGIVIQGVDGGFQLFLGGFRRHIDGAGIHADFRAAVALVADIDFAGRIVADQDDGQAGSKALGFEGRDAGSDFSTQLLRH